MKIKRLLALLLAFSLLLALPACGKDDAEDGEESSGSVAEEESDPNYPVEVRGIHLKRAPKGVVSFSPGLTEIICDLGYGGRLVGVSDYCAEGNDEVSGLPTCGTVNEPDLDAVRDAAPDVVVTASALSEEDTVQLQQMDADVIVLPRASTLDELPDLYADLGRVFEGDPAGAGAGQTLYTSQEARLDAVRARLEAAGGALEACYLRIFPLVVATGDTFEGELLEAAGFENSGKAYADWTYPSDKAIDLMPDVLFFDKAVGEDAVKGSQIYNTTPAFYNNRCFELDMELFERQGVRMFDLLEEMADQALGGAAGGGSAQPEDIG